MQADKEYTSIPGVRCTVSIFIVVILSCFVALFYLWGQVLFWVLILWIFMGMSIIISAYRLRALDRIGISSDMVRYRKQAYSWDCIYITVARNDASPFMRRVQLFAYFSDHYLSEDEMENGKTWFRMCLTEARWKHIARYYRKPVHWLSPVSASSSIDVEKMILVYNQQYGL